MFTLRKFLFWSAILGTLTFIGATLLQSPASNSQSSIQGLPSGISSFLQGFGNQSGPSADKTIADITFRLQIFSHSASLFVHRNVAAGRLQLEYMATTVRTNLSFDSWIPRGVPSWLQGGPQVAAQNAGAKASDLAKKVPVVSSAINATSNRFAAVRSSLSSAAGF
jgi:hypothetical protein